MDFTFTFWNILRRCTIIIDATEKPYYIFVLQNDPEIISEFGDEITITTDFENQFYKSNESILVKELKDAIFQSLKTDGAFTEIKNKLVSKFKYQHHRIVLSPRHQDSDL